MNEGDLLDFTQMNALNYSQLFGMQTFHCAVTVQPIYTSAVYFSAHCASDTRAVKPSILLLIK